MNLSGVEFKSMPSGLHNVTEDLVYGYLSTMRGAVADSAEKVLCDAAVCRG
jgi:hypothetical protein